MTTVVSLLEMLLLLVMVSGCILAAWIVGWLWQVSCTHGAWARMLLWLSAGVSALVLSVAVFPFAVLVVNLLVLLWPSVDAKRALLMVFGWPYVLPIASVSVGVGLTACIVVLARSARTAQQRTVALGQRLRKAYAT
ncbi:MAG: hypothetical protein EBQ80_01090 [Proteobacteria bacterium]|nr:hypothetical protein [Pseudomonadota bacterium]